MRKNKEWIRLITFIVILVFLCNDVVWAQDYLQVNSAFDKDPRNNDLFEKGDGGNTLTFLFFPILPSISDLDPTIAVISSFIFLGIYFFGKKLARIIRLSRTRLVSIFMAIVLLLSPICARAQTGVFSLASDELREPKTSDQRNLSFEELEVEIGGMAERIHIVLRDLGIDIPMDMLAGIYSSLIWKESRGRQFDSNGEVVTSKKRANGIAQLLIGKKGVLTEISRLLVEAIRSVVNPVRKGGALNPTLSIRNSYLSSSQSPQGAGLSNGVNNPEATNGLNIIRLINEVLFNGRLSRDISIWKDRMVSYKNDRKKVRRLQMQILQRLRRGFDIMNSPEDNLRIGFMYFALLIYRIAHIRDKDGDLLIEIYPNFPFIVAGLLAYNAGYTRVQRDIKDMLNGGMTIEELFREWSQDPSYLRHTEPILDFYRNTTQQKAPGPTWTDEKKEEFRVYFQGLIDGVETIKADDEKVKEAVEYEGVVIHIIPKDVTPGLGIPKYEGAISAKEMVYAVGMEEGDKLIIYVTQRYWDEFLSRNPLQLAEMIDHEWQEHMLGKSHSEAANRSWLFVPEGDKDGISPFHKFYLEQLAIEGDYDELYKISITTHINDPNNKFQDYARKLLYRENKILKELVAIVTERLDFPEDKLKEMAEALISNTFGPEDVVLVRFSYSSTDVARAIIEEILKRGAQVRKYIYDPELEEIIGGDRRFSSESYYKEATGVVEISGMYEDFGFSDYTYPNREIFERQRKLIQIRCPSPNDIIRAYGLDNGNPIGYRKAKGEYIRDYLEQFSFPWFSHKALFRRMKNFCKKERELPRDIEKPSLSLAEILEENKLLRQRMYLNLPALPYPDGMLKKISRDLLDSTDVDVNDVVFIRPHIAHLPVAREIARQAKRRGARVVYSIVNTEVNKVIIDNYEAELTRAEGEISQIEKADVAIGFNLVSAKAFVPEKKEKDDEFRGNFIIPVIKKMREVKRRIITQLPDATGVAREYGIDLNNPMGLVQAISDYLLNYINATNRNWELVNKGLLNLVELGNQAEEVIVRAEDGTSLRIRMLKNKMNGQYFVNDIGINYPHGEVCGVPESIEGEIFFPSAFINIPGVGQYEMRNLRLNIRGKEVIDFSVEDPEHKKKLEDFFNRNPARRIIGEFAIGTASGVKPRYDVLLLEKMMGIHIAFGTRIDGVDNGSDWHCDIPKQDVDVYFKIGGRLVHILDSKNRFAHPGLEYLSPKPDFYLITAYELTKKLEGFGIKDVKINWMKDIFEKGWVHHLRRLCKGLSIEQIISIFNEATRYIGVSPEFWGLFFWNIFEKLSEEGLLNIAEKRIPWISIFAWRELARRGSIEGFKKILKAMKYYFPDKEDEGNPESEKAYFYCIYFTYNIEPLLKRLIIEDIGSSLFGLLDRYYNNDRYRGQTEDIPFIFTVFGKNISFDLRQLNELRDFYMALNDKNDPSGDKRKKVENWWRKILKFRLQPPTDSKAVLDWVCRRTYPRRLKEIDRIILDLLDEFSGDVSILDAGISDGTTTIELKEAIEKKFGNRRIYITGGDKHLFLYESRRDIYLHDPRKVAQNNLLQEIEHKRMRYNFNIFLDEKSEVQSQAVYPINRISLVNPCAKGISLQEMDVFSPIDGEYDIIRCFGLLIPGEERGYFSDEKVREGVINLGLALRENRVLLVGTVAPRKGNPISHLIAFRRVGNRLVKLREIGVEPIGYEGIFDEDFIEISSPDFPDAEGVSARYLINMENVKEDVDGLIDKMPDEGDLIIVRDINDFVDLSKVEEKGDRLLFSHKPGIKAILDKVKNGDGIRFIFMAKPQKMELASRILKATGLFGSKIFLYEYTRDIVEEAKEKIGDVVDKRRIVYFVKSGYNLTEDQKNRIASGHLKMIESAGGKSNFYAEVLFAIIYARINKEERDALLDIMKRLGMDVDKLEPIIKVRFIRIEEVMREFENYRLYVSTST